MAAEELFTMSLYSDANLQAYYRFNTGALTTDSKNSNTLTNTNTVGETASGKFGYGADFGASNTNKNFEISAVADPFLGVGGSEACSFNMWFKLSTEIASGLYGIFQLEIYNLGTNKLTRYRIGYEYNGGSQRLVFSRLGSADIAVYIDSGALGTANWHMVTLVWDTTNIIPYFDGVAGTPTAASGVFSGGSTSDIFIGTYGGAFYSGLMDDVGIYDRVLTPTEITDLYNGSSIGSMFFF